MKDPFAPDPTQCPQCNQHGVITEYEACVQPYGICPNTVKLVFAMPTRRCLKCGLIFTDMDGEKAQTDALGLYRRVLCPTPNVRRWIANVKDRALAGVPASTIEQVVKSWELYRLTMTEAGEGIEPPPTGV